ncbi:hypothetical protein GCM10027563_18690 [Parasphingorhabdus pacifica]
MVGKKLLGAIAVSGGVLVLGTSVALAGGADDRQAHHPTNSPVNGEGVYTGPAPDEIQRGPAMSPHGPWPENCMDESPEISGDRARVIALEEVPGATVTEVDLDRCYFLEWELELRKGNTEYDIDVDARTRRGRRGGGGPGGRLTCGGRHRSAPSSNPGATRYTGLRTPCGVHPANSPRAGRQQG